MAEDERDGGGALTRELLGALRELLSQSLAFVPIDDPSIARTVVRLKILEVEGGRIGARARIAVDAAAALDEPPRGPDGLVEICCNRTPRALARRLASGIYRYHLDSPGPFTQKIAFVAGTGAQARSLQVFVVGFDGHGLRRVSRQGAPNILPAWSRDNDLAYTSYLEGRPALVLIPAGEGQPRPLVSSNGLNVGAAFSPDGRTIALASSREGNTDIHLVGRDGTPLRRLTRHPGIDVSPSWSPDGRQLAFVSDRSGSPQVYVMSLDGDTEPRRLTRTGSYNQEPDWCPLPGSTRIAYTRRHAGERYEIHVVDAANGRDTQLTRDLGANASPSWSVDCRLILFSRGRQGLWVMATDGRRRQVWDGPARSPAWSAPDREPGD